MQTSIGILNMDISQKIHAVSESFELLGFKLLAACARVSGDEYINGYAELARNLAIKNDEIHIANRMKNLG